MKKFMSLGEYTYLNGGPLPTDDMSTQWNFLASRRALPSVIPCDVEVEVEDRGVPHWYMVAYRHNGADFSFFMHASAFTFCMRDTHDEAANLYTTRDSGEAFAMMNFDLDK